MTDKINLLGLSCIEMEEFFLSLGEKKYRAHQMLKWMHIHQADNFEQMTDVGKKLRDKLSAIAEIRARKSSMRGFPGTVPASGYSRSMAVAPSKPYLFRMAVAAPCVCPRRSVVRWIAASVLLASRVSSAISPVPRLSVRCGWPAVPSGRARTSGNTRLPTLS